MWYYTTDGKQMGPVEEEELKGVAARGGLAPTDLVWKEGMAAWQPASAVPELGVAGSPPPPAAPMAPYAPAVAPPPPPYAEAQYSMAPGGPQGPVLPDYLPWAIVVTLFCCLPAGIASIVFASRANSAKAQGDWATAEMNNKQAKTWLIVSASVGVAIVVLVVIANIFGALATMSH